MEGKPKGKPGAPHLFSVEQKNCTHGLMLLLSGAGGRYMASEKQVSSSFSSSILGQRAQERGSPEVPSSSREEHAPPPPSSCSGS